MVCARWHSALVLSSVVMALAAPASAPAQDPADHRQGAAAAQDAPAERKARTRERDAQADSHTAVPVQDAEPQHFRGQITRVDNAWFTVKTRGGNVRIRMSDATTTISLSKGSFSSVDFGTYVGAVAVRLDQYSPIVRDSAVWLHKGYELRIIDEELRGIALGHKKWDLTADSIISQGWVDDIEVRVLSIKWGPTDYDETDVEVPRDVPVLRMSLGEKSLISAGAHVMVGATRGADGKYEAAFIFVGKDGIVPPL